MLNNFISFETGVVIPLIYFVITVPLSALVLFLNGKIFKQDIPYDKSLIPALIIGVISLIFGLIMQAASDWIVIIILLGFSSVIILALYLTLPKLIFNLKWNKGLLIGLVWFGFMVALSFVVRIIIEIVITIITLVI